MSCDFLVTCLLHCPKEKIKIKIKIKIKSKENQKKIKK